jgi:hypothetical protein
MSFAALDEELARWRDAGVPPKLWLRDDDATRPTPALDRLLDLTKAHDAPLLLAVIPKPSGVDLAERLAGEALVTPAVHGFAHANHAPAGAKATELTEDAAGRDIDAVAAELRFGRTKLLRLFEGRLSGIWVPPWNRISPAVARQVPALGFTAVSIFGWQETGAALPHLNTQVDLMNWRGGRVGFDSTTVTAVLAARLGEARLRGGAPVGILTHHLAHDETAWRSFEMLLDHLQMRSDVTFTDAAACLENPQV